MKEKVLIKWLTIKNKNVIFKGIVHSKSKILSPFTQPHVIDLIQSSAMTGMKLRL